MTEFLPLGKDPLCSVVRRPLTHLERPCALNVQRGVGNSACDGGTYASRIYGNSPPQRVGGPASRQRDPSASIGPSLRKNGSVILRKRPSNWPEKVLPLAQQPRTPRGRRAAGAAPESAYRRCAGSGAVSPGTILKGFSSRRIRIAMTGLRDDLPGGVDAVARCSRIYKTLASTNVKYGYLTILSAVPPVTLCSLCHFTGSNLLSIDSERRRQHDRGGRRRRQRLLLESDLGPIKKRVICFVR
ncbi:hypothetical protein EVAR_83808_1 [Eumeta japonica]|uniref:Uncharacterized protein n=1 Tax=Eumeta variegata TaxID=151549 RepID=A0A4C1WHM5_EUMVA|nr:hypothetical protein EVAR_83808_1 [Eumeta japonica]